MYGRKKIPSDFDEVDTAPIPRKRFHSAFVYFIVLVV